MEIAIPTSQTQRRASEGPSKGLPGSGDGFRNDLHETSMISRFPEARSEDEIVGIRLFFRTLLGRREDGCETRPVSAGIPAYRATFRA
jgi:hypothetical protein